MNPSEWLPRLTAEIQRIGILQLAAYRGLESRDIQWKQDPTGEPSVVTRWDVETESMLRDFVIGAFPSHSFLGEEQGDDQRDVAHYWVLDPIDGTANFVDGIPYWGTSLAYWRDGATRLGIVHFPALERTFTAIEGAGAWDTGAPLRTPTPAADYSLRGCVALDGRTHLRQALHLRTRVRILGSAIANLCFTATGTFQASATRAKLWDLAAGDLLLRESRCVVETDPDLAAMQPSRYMSDGSGARITLWARGNATLPSLAEFLIPVHPDAP